MRVTLTTRGGLAAALGPRVRAVSSDALDPEQEHELRRLVADASSADPVVDDGAGRDVMSYTITIDDDGDVRELRVSDTTMSPAFSALVSWLEEH